MLTEPQTDAEAIANSEYVFWRRGGVAVFWLTRNTNKVRAGFKSMCSWEEEDAGAGQDGG